MSSHWSVVSVALSRLPVRSCIRRDCSWHVALSGSPEARGSARKSSRKARNVVIESTNHTRSEATRKAACSRNDSRNQRKSHVMPARTWPVSGMQENIHGGNVCLSIRFKPKIPFVTKRPLEGWRMKSFPSWKSSAAPGLPPNRQLSNWGTPNVAPQTSTGPGR